MVGVVYLLPMNQRDESTMVEADGKSLRLTHLSKVMFPDDGFTKAELLTLLPNHRAPSLALPAGAATDPESLSQWSKGAAILPASAGISVDRHWPGVGYHC